MIPSSQCFSQFRVANQYLNDSERLHSLFEEEGYLFFREVVNLDEVQEVKLDFIRVLKRQGVLEPHASGAVWSGAGIDRIDDSELYALPSFLDLADSKDTLQFVERIFGEPVFMFKSVDIRYALPNDSVHVTPGHQDFFFVPFIRSFRTLWIPLVDIDERVGGLALSAGSHKRGLLEHVEQETVYSYIFKGRKQRGVRLESLPQTWLTTNYHPGDMLMFHNLMVHRALPNRSERIRLSIDYRCQPATAPRTWQAEKSILEARKIRETARRIATEEGASEVLFEDLLIELMRQGLEPERAQIKALMSELGSKQGNNIVG